MRRASADSCRRNPVGIQFERHVIRVADVLQCACYFSERDNARTDLDVIRVAVNIVQMEMDEPDPDMPNEIPDSTHISEGSPVGR